MADYQNILNTFDEEPSLPKFAHKRWVKIHPNQANYPDNGNGVTSAIQYNCKTIMDKLVNYQDGYILLAVNCTRAALPAKTLAPKGSHSFIHQAVLRINNKEVDNSRFNYLTMAMLNYSEFSNDYARVAEQYMFSKDTNEGHANNPGHTTRKAMIPDPNNNALAFSIKIPLSYVSTFFRALDFPILNQLVEVDVTFRLANAILREGGGAITVSITSAILYLPVVEMPRKYEEKLLQKLSSSSMKKSFTWLKLVYRDLGNKNGAQDLEIEPSIDGIRKLYCVAIPVARWNSQEHIESTSNTAVTAINIVIDSEDFYPQEIQNDIEAYDLTSECFNMGGKDQNTGAILSFSDFLTVHRYYIFDLSRQKIFASDPRKSQSIRFRGTLSANSRLFCFLAQEKKTTFDFKNASNTSTA